MIKIEQCSKYCVWNQYFSNVSNENFILVIKKPRKLQEEEERADSSITKRVEERDDEDVSDDDNSRKEGEFFIIQYFKQIFISTSWVFKSTNNLILIVSLHLTPFDWLKMNNPCCLRHNKADVKICTF